MKVSAVRSLLLLIILSSSVCLSANASAGDHHELKHFMVVPTSSLKHLPEDAACSGHKVIPSNGTTWVPMNRPHGPCSSTSSRASEDTGIDVDDMLMWDQLRTSYIRTQLSTDASGVGAGIPIIARSTTVSNRDYTPSSTASVGTNSGTSKSDFRFGCSHAVRGSFSNQNAGILALGGGRGSLLEQTAEAYGNAFSYCIPQPSSAGFLSLGGPVEASLKFAYTPLIKNKHAPTFYIVHLEAIIVAGKQLGVPPTAFAAGTVMDSGAVVTQLPPPVYAALRAAFRSAMEAYGPLAAPVRNLDTCYDFTRFPEVKVPKVSLVFAGGATLELDPASIVLDGCLAFAATPGEESVGFIGNVQQQTYEVLYDVGGGSVGFRRGAC